MIHIDQTSVCAHMLAAFMTKAECPDVDREALRSWCQRQIERDDPVTNMFLGAVIMYLHMLDLEDRKAAHPKSDIVKEAAAFGDETLNEVLNPWDSPAEND